ncbi:MAG: hypothetical protein KGH69_04685 [Candidatus Micrarchaeota archaeon]|nr:hypothetical protein [Candidatus Micrarchaeota archaeon]
MMYFIYSGMFFERSLYGDLLELGKFRVLEHERNAMIIETERDFIKEHDKKPSMFVHGMFRMDVSDDIDEGRYVDSLYDMVRRLKLPKGKKIRIECYNVNSKKGLSAKQIEMELSDRLRKDGYNPEMISPDVLLYLVLVNMRCYAGIESYRKLEQKFLNPLRHYGSETGERMVSRAEAKLLEAFDVFRIKGKGIAIDLGAAPGGWSMVLAKKGYKVVAIDNADLEYEKIEGQRLSTKVLTNLKKTKKTDINEMLRNVDIVHIRENANTAFQKISLKGVTMIADDMNIEPEQSAQLLMDYLGFAKKGAHLVMTVKCISKRVSKHVSKAEGILGPRFRIKSVKELPNNRQEVTLFARLV